MSENEKVIVRRRRILWSRVFLVLVIFFLLIAGIAGMGMYAYATIFHASTGSFAMPFTDNLNGHDKRINILLLGVDNGDKEHPGTSRHSDTVIVAGINTADGSIRLLSIPRDTKVDIPGQKGFDKIANAFAYGGPDLLARTVEESFHIPINYYAVLDWQAFVKIVNILGGVDLYVEHDMNYEDPYDNLRIHLLKGYQHLDGLKAGEYVRFRHDELGDIGRVQRQQRFLKTFSSELFQWKTLFKVPAFISAYRQYIHTDIPAVAWVKMAVALKSLKGGGLYTEMLPGDFATINGSSYWVVNKEETKQLLESMFMITDTKVSEISHGHTKNN
ncbi:Hypothetical protein LUCI_3152 [Lucifera butyrica]|uniref:Cell envelope-related transcriptional attenuator domain-containing protein n=1 Tax=Lucifera butyrica TaxID=1351585 RepID=A0A498RAC1_9FIRM|nr:LCP family protein [Lucifera butyrica]VBB07887.1 Hypothetical protein LUCI_3152 [Lucifera butyrica]